jgi:hypothetical protein
MIDVVRNPSIDFTILQGMKKALFFQSLGRDDWIRTSDPFVPNEVRYRAALHPE